MILKFATIYVAKISLITLLSNILGFNNGCVTVLIK